MRFLAFILLISCAQSTPLKFKYSSAKRYLASLTNEDVVVAKIEGELKNPSLFASGMESTFLIVKLYDEKGALLKDVDPSDLTLSASEDIQARPFTLKQGVYKAEIMPLVFSKTIRMRVDWLERTVSEEIVLVMGSGPMKDKLELLDHHKFQSPRLGDDRESNAPTDGFSIENTGDNRVVNSTKNVGSQRVFNFHYPEQARQNITLEVWDAPNQVDSDVMFSVFGLFPRKQLPIAEMKGNIIEVTLPTGEKMSFNKDSKEVIGGVFSEGPIDVSRDRFKRHYPDIKYQGRGVLLRVNARGQSPELGQFENTKIDLDHGTKGSAEVLLINGTTGEKCRRPKSDFWEPIDVNPIEFKFPTDEEFDLYLRNNCGFGIPRF